MDIPLHVMLQKQLFQISPNIDVYATLRANINTSSILPEKILVSFFIKWLN
jgi:hypothetical protein